ncbi:type II secretion system protein [Lactococcus paracarnosus]|uniref:Type II secretion system protein n=1 Tax=Pseudolactococcus paracarnosus TaxID=2749962 RepID=A0ABT0AKZ4_9LACT|nr:type II secretion system protein [Lactococcus paracarnosus]MCJ1977239.1 type II secretion system protein [Lactococcus paracarnosus]MCJ1983265.1 type II secretion system protein [Lactococcus paracarnosus]MCJ1998075.1 type II secretion system protein [Lactococcus paracarnosus]
MNKLALLVKDEEGMTLVELLAVIVILSIVAAIGGVAITGVIQRSREDARVADVNMLYEAAQLAEASDSYISGKPNKEATAADLQTQGYSTTINFIEAAARPNVKFKMIGGGATADKLVVTIPEKAIKAGSKTNVLISEKGAEFIKSLTRVTLFATGTPTPSGQ